MPPGSWAAPMKRRWRACHFAAGLAWRSWPGRASLFSAGGKARRVAEQAAERPGERIPPCDRVGSNDIWFQARTVGGGGDPRSGADVAFVTGRFKRELDGGRTARATGAKGAGWVWWFPLDVLPVWRSGQPDYLGSWAWGWNGLYWLLKEPLAAGGGCWLADVPVLTIGTQLKRKAVAEADRFEGPTVRAESTVQPADPLPARLERKTSPLLVHRVSPSIGAVYDPDVWAGSSAPIHSDMNAYAASRLYAVDQYASYRRPGGSLGRR